LNKLALFFRVVRGGGENGAEVIETTAGKKLIYDKKSLRFFTPDQRNNAAQNFRYSCFFSIWPLRSISLAQRESSIVQY